MVHAQLTAYSSFTRVRCAILLLIFDFVYFQRASVHWSLQATSRSVSHLHNSRFVGSSIIILTLCSNSHGTVLFPQRTRLHKNVTIFEIMLSLNKTWACNVCYGDCRRVNKIQTIVCVPVGQSRRCIHWNLKRISKYSDRLQLQKTAAWNLASLEDAVISLAHQAGSCVALRQSPTIRPGQVAGAVDRYWHCWALTWTDHLQIRQTWSQSTWALSRSCDANTSTAMYRRVPKLWAYGSVCWTCTGVTENTKNSMGPKLGYPTVIMLHQFWNVLRYNAQKWEISIDCETVGICALSTQQ